MKNNKPIPNYKNHNSVSWNNKTIDYIVTWFDNGICTYTFDCPLSNDEQQQIIDYITLYPFIV